MKRFLFIEIFLPLLFRLGSLIKKTNGFLNRKILLKEELKNEQENNKILEKKFKKIEKQVLDIKKMME